MADVVAAEDQRADQWVEEVDEGFVLVRERGSEFCEECGEPLSLGIWDEDNQHIGWWCCQCYIDYDLDGNLVSEREER